MARFGERFLLGFTSPRTPKLISEYIKVIEENKMDNLPYDTAFQEKFYTVLSKAQVAGEEAGTKLMIPLFLMLIIVFAIVIVPAFFSIRI